MALFAEADLAFTPEEVWRNPSRHPSFCHGVYGVPGPIQEIIVQDW